MASRSAGDGRQRTEAASDEAAADSTTTSAAGTRATGNGRRPFYRKPLPMTLLVAGVLVALLGAGAYWRYARQFVSTDDAFLKGHPVQVSPQVAGPLVAVPVDENQDVARGDVLARIDPADYRVALDRARTRRDAAKARLAQARAGVGTVQAEVDAADSRLEVTRIEARNAASDLERLKGMGDRYVDKSQLDDARDRLDEARAQRRAAAQRLASKKAGVTSAKAGVEAARADLAQARAGIRQARLDLSHTTITAPVDGQVATVGVEAGEYVKPGQALMAVVPDQVWVKANFKETQITHMRPGQPVDIHIDAYPDRTFRGHVVAIQRATGSEFGLLPPQNATGNYVKVVQRVPVRIVFDQRPDVHTLAPGLSVVPTVRVLPHPAWPW